MLRILFQHAYYSMFFRCKEAGKKYNPGDDGRRALLNFCLL